MPTHLDTASNKTDYQTRDRTEARFELWEHWPVNWTAIWVGALSAIAFLFICGLIGVALGASSFAPEQRMLDLKRIGIEAIALGVIGSFTAFVIGGWIAAKIAGILHSEPAMLHGATVWVLVTSLVLVFTAVGAGDYLGTWNNSLIRNAQSPAPYDRPEMLTVGASTQDVSNYRAEQLKYRDDLRNWRQDTPRAVRNSALCAITALLLGLMGSVIGGWMGSGEPMTFNHHLTRQPRRAAV